ncbi:MAG: hypothetical protein ABEJ56_03655 [Candidatus Nanohaloarchaea archaeon]
MNDVKANRTTDGRFREQRVFFDNQKQIRSLINEAKKAKECTWKEFGEEFGVSEYTVRRTWRKESDSLPLSIVRRLEKITGENVEKEFKQTWHGQRKGGKISNRRGEIPETWSPELAEFYGALLGDGCIYSDMNTVCISGNSDLDEEYLGYLADLCRSIFDIEPKFYFSEGENVVRLIINSRKVAEFLINSGFVKGEKKEAEFRIPEVLYNSGLVGSVVRGLFDTDGGIYSHPNSEIMADITSMNSSIREFLIEAIKILDLPLKLSNNKFQAYGYENIRDFYREIGSSNSRNIKRYIFYMENDRLPAAGSEIIKNSVEDDFSIPNFGFVV